ncbi:MAG: DNA mismatch repair endonuclease MutL [Chlamydiales bacterium]
MLSNLSKIKVLCDRTINQIAAGEVIENGASVVKELVENALDAGAQDIVIETQGGGRGLIRVSDNGQGMTKEDLPLALMRHATSKLTEFEDINSLRSFGFRGEALAAIASVSKMKLLSSADDSGQGTEIYLEGGEIKSLQAAVCLRGTTVEIKSLFFNAPVRKKFRKSVAADTAEIHKVLSQMALSNLPVTFSWIRDGKREFLVQKEESWYERIETMLGKEFILNSFKVEEQEASLKIEGYISSPSNHRINRSGQYLFINGRSVNSQFISKCVLEGYGTRLPTHRFPLFVLSLTLPLVGVDVNVHPQKKQVRLKDEGEVRSFLIQAIDKSLQRKTKLFKPALPLSFEEGLFEDNLMAVSEPIMREEAAEVQKELLPEVSFRVIGKVASYLFLEEARGICVVDVSLARARILYEEMLEKKENRSIHNLLIPINLEFSGDEKIKLLDSLDVLNEMGIGIRHFGGSTFLIDALPSYFEIDEISNIIHAFFEEGKKVDTKRLTLRFCRTLKGPVRSFEEGKALVERLYRCEVPDESPDGYPISILLTKKELEKQFKKKHE